MGMVGKFIKGITKHCYTHNLAAIDPLASEINHDCKCGRTHGYTDAGTMGIL